MRVIVAGSREFQSYQTLKKECDRVILTLSTPLSEIEIISGHANGADKMGERYAEERGLKLTIFPAEWENLEATPRLIRINQFGEKYNALAGHNRNEKMAKYAAEDHGVLIAYWNCVSRGTRGMIDLAKLYKLKLFIIQF